MKRFLREPMVHFFVLGSLLFLVHHVVVGEPRTIAVSAGLEAELARRFRDRTGRAPDPAELEASLREWKRDEALFREALREGLDRDDPNIRNVLIEKMRARKAMEAPKVDPSDAQLDAWLATHRKVYERPLRYAVEWVAFSRGERSAAEQREKFQRSVEGGADARLLGRSIFGANLTAEEVRERLGAGVADRLAGLARGKWLPVEGTGDLLLLRVNEVEGGMPPADELRARLIVDFTQAEQQRAVEQAVQVIVDRYHFEARR